MTHPILQHLDSLFKPAAPDAAPKVGQYLYASCSAEDYGRIVAVGEDPNGPPKIDIELFHPNDLVDCDDDEHAGSENPLTSLELIGDGAKLILRDVHYKMGIYEGGIVCNTPGNGCFRCTKMFTLYDQSFEERCA